MSLVKKNLTYSCCYLPIVVSHWEDREKALSHLGESVSGALPPSVPPRWEGSPPSQSELSCICLLLPFWVRLHWEGGTEGSCWRREGAFTENWLDSTTEASVLSAACAHGASSLCQALGVQRWKYWNSGERFTYEQMKWYPIDLLQRAEMESGPSRGRTRQGACAVPAQQWRKQSFRTFSFVASGESSSQSWE